MRSPNTFSEQQGFLTFAQNTDEVDYLELAYYQAVSIKQTQQINSYAVAVDAQTKEKLNETHYRVFDYIVDLPVDHNEPTSRWKLANEWQAWHITPFKETIKLESDLLFTQNIDHWWTGLRHREVCLTTKIRDYEGTVSNDRTYRRMFDDSNLPDVYNGIMYFRFGQTSMQFFQVAELVYQHWPLFRDHVLTNCREDVPSTDVVFAIAAQLIGPELCTIPALDYPSFVHMKGAINRLDATADWRQALHFEQDATDMFIGFTRQQWPVHYYQKDFLNERISAELVRGLEQPS
jgi:hypothetical protein